ncbi:MAG: transposase [Phototrophicaceae bacterium]
MSNRYKIVDQRGLYFLTLTVEGWVDIFSRKAYRDVLIESLKYCQDHKGLQIYAYVIMTNHLHLVVRSDGELSLSEIIGQFKSYVATSILKDLPSAAESRKEWLFYLFGYFAKVNKRKSTHQFWKTDNHPIELYSEKVIRQKLDYIHYNPVRAGWVNFPQHYNYSSASNYLAEGKGILEVSVLDQYYERPS